MDSPSRSREARERPKKPLDIMVGSPSRSSAKAAPTELPATPTGGSHPAHRYHHKSCGNSRTNSIDSKGSRSTKASGDEGLRKSTMVSNLLLERLEQERQTEGERGSRQPDAGMSASTGNLSDRAARDSPAQRSLAALSKKSASDGQGEHGEHKGFGVKEMEQALSTLHKQNFDLKLELYHRRERQTALETRIAQLEAEKTEADATLDSMQFELESRDKAISEAVAMIVQLETRVEELLDREREMVRQVEAGGSYQSPPHSDPDDFERSITPRPSAADFRRLPRMPSFLSDLSEHTEHLRNVVLANRKSFMHTRNTSETSADVSEFNRMTGSSLSILSESSFASVYGANSGPDNESLDGEGNSTTPQLAIGVRVRPLTISRDSRRGSVEASNGRPGRADSASAQPVAESTTLDQFPSFSSPAQQYERPEKNMPPPSNFASGLKTPSPSHMDEVLRQQRAVGGKAEDSQQFHAAGGLPRDFGGFQNLPPTPDTMASSQHRNRPGQGASPDNFNPQSPTSPQFNKSTSSNRSSEPAKETNRRRSRDMNNQLASLTAFTSGGIDHRMPTINTDFVVESFKAGHDKARNWSQSTAHTNVLGRPDSWVSDSDSEAGGGAPSEAEGDYDYWLKESLKPNKPAAQAGRPSGEQRRPSPDLFSFPASSSGWQPDQIFGALRGQGVMSSPVEALKRDHPGEKPAVLTTARRLSAAEPAVQSQQAPPTPHRGSSLQPRNGGTDGPNLLRKDPERSPFRSPKRFSLNRSRGRSHSIDITTQTSPPPKMQPLEHQPQPAEPTKKNYYPPVTGQTGKGRINAFFRKAGSMSLAAGALAGVVAQPQAPAVEQGSGRDGRSSVPPPSPRAWPVNSRNGPGVVEVDYLSATPPPIMRSRAATLEQEPGPQPGAAAGGAQNTMTSNSNSKPSASDMGHDGARPEPREKENNDAPAQGKRRWLGLGRMGSVKNR